MSKSHTTARRPTIQHWLEYLTLGLIVMVFRWLPRQLSRAAGRKLGWLVFRLAGRLRSIGDKNLQIAFPAMQRADRGHLLEKTFHHLGLQLSEFCLMSRYSADFARGKVMRYEGLQHFEEAKQAGKGVLVLTGHLGAWELSSFLHSLLGYPMSMVIRRLDNPLLDRFVNRIRCLHGNKVLNKDDFARSLLSAMARGEAVGILMDTNMTPPQGIFVPFFGKEACTASGLARVARRTGAAVIPGFLLWNDQESRYILRFGERLKLQYSSDTEGDVRTNTALFARVTEQYIREYPDQWLWLHRRWKTRPADEPPLYDRQNRI